MEAHHENTHRANQPRGPMTILPLRYPLSMVIKERLMDLCRNSASKGINPLVRAIKGINKGLQPLAAVGIRVVVQV